MRKKLLPLIFIALGGGGFLFFKSSQPEALPPAPTEKIWPVSVQPAVRQTLSPVLNLFGRVESPREAKLSAALASDVLEVAIAEGEIVLDGALLIRLDDWDAQIHLAERVADVAEIEAQIDSENQRHRADLRALEHEQTLLALAGKSVERAERLANTRVGAESQVDEANQSLMQQALAVTSRQLAIDDHDARLSQLRARLARARAQRRQAERDVERTRIVAPYLGRVTVVHVSIGDRVRVGDVVVELFDTSRVEVRTQIPTRYLTRLRQALDDGKTIYAVAEVDGRRFRLTLDRLAGRVKSRSGGVDGFFEIITNPSRLELGRTVDIRVELPPEPGVIAIPFEAVYGVDRVYKVAEGRMRGLRVERVGEYIDADGESYILIRSDAIKDSEQIVVSQLPNAVDGLRIAPRAN